jgi:hypothetical protein
MIVVDEERAPERRGGERDAVGEKQEERCEEPHAEAMIRDWSEGGEPETSEGGRITMAGTSLTSARASVK